MKNKKQTLLLLFTLLLTQILYAQQSIDNLRDSIATNFSTQLNLFPQEKVHLHTDRELYSPAEKIWFKAYLVDAYHHQYLQQSRYVYVELIAPADTLIQRVMIAPQNDMYHGYIKLPTETPAGAYTLCAYSKHMENQGKEYFFRKKIHVVPSVKVREEKEEDSKDTKPAKKKDYEVYFFPEGGNIPAGERSMVAFKALDEDGNAEIITGWVIDSSGKEVLEVNTLHEGMGTFSLFSKTGETYSLRCTNHQGTSKTFKLPAAQPNVFALSCTARKNMLLLNKLHATEANTQEKHYLLAHCKGGLFHFEEWDEEKAISFRLDELPAGIIQFLLLDEQLNPLSERLFFSKNYETTTIDFSTNKIVYDKRELISCELSVSDKDAIPLLSNLSVAITDDEDIVYDGTAPTILSSLLLTSELNGYIASPGYYFENNDAERTQALDCLMLTHGWRRYDIPKVVKGEFTEPAIQAEVSQTISGMVKTLVSNHPVVKTEVNFLAHKKYVTGKALTDENGRFCFGGFELPDSTTYAVQALSNKGKKTVELLLDETTYPILKKLPHRKEEITTFANHSSYAPKVMQREHTYNEKMRSIQLDEVVITANKVDKMKDKMPYFSSFATRSINSEAIKKKRPRATNQALWGLPKVKISPTGEVGLYGRPGSFIDETTPMVYVDGMRMGRDFNINDIPVEDIYQIDVFNDKIALSAFPRSDRDTGVISIIMKAPEDRAHGEQFNIKTTTPLGIQKPVAFYAPRYDTKTPNHNTIDIRTTLFWKPDVITDEEGKASFDFYSADYYTTYTVIIEGVTEEGLIVRAVEKIKIGEE
ncbi:hypothetical protein D0T50_01875 [Bacteroides sp. 214]|uniref:TonB-dependent receptor n=1 Tax=Bacteroides sp. 214 TaxID=2302935 RepID=UPI0013D5A14D|nr:Plug domain-containing protein [Bacteroides sp. 214]NDW11635.1 hypothetical protein [Bacteroides sp. 214]